MTPSGVCRSSWLRPEVVRLPPVGRALGGGGVGAGDASPGVAGDSLGESRSLMSISSRTPSSSFLHAAQFPSGS